MQLQPMANDPAGQLHYESAKSRYEKTFAKAIEAQYSCADAYCYATEKATLTREHGEQPVEEMMRTRERGLE